MSAKDSPKLSKTDWVKVDALTDAEIDTSEGLLDEDFFRRAELRLPEKHRAAVTAQHRCRNISLVSSARRL